MATKRVVLIASLLANLLLAIAYVRKDAATVASFDELEKSDSQEIRILSKKVEGQVAIRPGTDSESELSRLRSLGLTDEETLPLILFKLQAGSATPQSPNTSYWEHTWRPIGFERIADERKRRENTASSLINLYGPEAQNSKPLREVLRPGRAVEITNG